MCSQPIQQFPVVPVIHDNLITLMNSYFQNHSKVLIVRADVRYPVEYPRVDNNLHIQRCMAKTIQYFQRKGLEPAYMGVREQNESIHPHYHCIFLLNGQRTQSPQYVFNILERYWGNTLQVSASGLIDYCNDEKNGQLQENGQVVMRKDGIPDFVYRQIGYLAKPFSKGESNDGLRDFGMSRIPHNPQPQSLF